ncbi:MAG: PD-(D/E)XK nuclease family protein, partial [Acidimicrobiales bacterium]
MAFPVPRSLSPSKVSSFTDCALAFRFSAIDRLPEPPTAAATRGTLVHAALERLHLLAPAERTVGAALACLDAALVVPAPAAAQYFGRNKVQWED